MNETTALGTQKIPKLIAKFAIPSIVASIINAVYNIVDRVFLAAFCPTSGVLGGLQTGFPLMLFTFGVGLMISIGFSTLTSIQLGCKNKERAGRIYQNGFLITLILSVLLTLIGSLLLQPILRLSGATETPIDTLSHGTEYMRIVLLGLPAQLLALYLSAIARTEGRPNLSMISQVIPALINILLDYIFIGPLKMGVKGAALATIIGQIIGCIILLVFYFMTKKSIFRWNAKDMHFSWRLIGSAFAIGASSFIMQVGNVIANICVNNQLSKYGSGLAMDAFAGLSSLFTIVFMPLIGLKDGVVPIIGYNHGAGNHARAKSTLLWTLLIGCAFASVFTVFLQCFPKVFLSMFFGAETPTMALAVQGSHYLFMMLPIIAINICGTAYLQSTKRTVSAFITSVSRQVGFLIPSLYLLPLKWGIGGVWLSYPVSDALSIALTITLLLITFRSLKKMQAKTVPSDTTTEQKFEAANQQSNTINVTDVEDNANQTNLVSATAETIDPLDPSFRE